MLKQWISRAALGRTAVNTPFETTDAPDADFEATWRHSVKSRLLIVLAFLGVWAVALEARLVFLQVVSHDEYAALAQKQQSSVIEPEAGRGDILDRNGEVLAYSVEGHQLNADPSQVEDPRREAAEICAALGDCTRSEQAEFAAKLGRRGRFVPLRKARAVSPAAAAGIRALVAARTEARVSPVVWLTAESRRYYPKYDLAAHVLGFVGDGGRGGEGVEAKFDKDIAGERGRVLVQFDSTRRQIATFVERAPTAGATLELTIDLRLQHIAERELKAAVDTLGADGGSVVILAPYTGEILAQATYPTFNPNAFWTNPGNWRNRVVTDTYEPGSTFKIVTASAAIEDGKFSPSDLIDTNPGFVKLPGRKPIVEVHRKNYGVLTFENVLVKSSNVGAIRIGERVGPDRMQEYIRRFGFGEILTRDFDGQSRGQVHQPGKVDESALASLSMGYEIGVTPMQVAAAASVVANGGVLMEPHVVRAFIRGGRREVVEPKALRRVISPETAATMTAIMEGVVEHGTARAASLERYRVAGKTGTAQKAIKGGYSQTEHNVSFVGIVPSRRPELTILVVIDTPRRGAAYGGTVAAPIFKRIAEASLQQLGVPPSINPVPPIIAASGRQILPAPPSRAAELIPRVLRVGGRPVMPDLQGMSLRDALRVTNELGLSMTTDGEGVVIFQSPAPGAFVDPSGAGVLQLRRRPTSDRGGR